MFSSVFELATVVALVSMVVHDFGLTMDSVSFPLAFNCGPVRVDLYSITFTLIFVPAALILGETVEVYSVTVSLTID